MQLEVGKIYEGKVTGIREFGAFVELEKGTTGMVHISEVANTYVSQIKDFLEEGQTVKVKVLSLGEDGKISLSIKKALPAPPPRSPRPEGSFNRGGNGGQGGFHGGRGGNGGGQGGFHGGQGGSRGGQGGFHGGQGGGFHGGQGGSHGGQGGQRSGGFQPRPNGRGRTPYVERKEPQDFSKNPPPIFDGGANSGNSDFEDMLNKFKTVSEERYTDLKKTTDNKRKSPSRRK